MVYLSRYFFPTALLLTSITFFATDIYLPSFPAIQEEFQSSKSAVQWSLSLYLAGWALSQLFYGPLSDKIGRRRVILGSLGFGLLGTLISLFAPSISTLILGRTLQGLGLGGSSVMFRAVLRDAYSGDRLAHYGSIGTIATAIFMAMAPDLGGYIQHFLGWRFCFLFLVVYIIGVWVAVWHFIPETNQHLNPMALQKKTLLDNYLHLLKNRIFLGYTLVSSLVLGGLSIYLTASPFLFERVLQLDPVQYGRLAWIIGGGFGIGGICNILLVKKIGRHRSLVVGISAIFLSGLLMLTLSLFGYLNTFVIMLPMGIFSLGAAVSFANSFAGAFQPFPKIAGSAGALYGSIQVFGGSLASGLMSLLQEQTQKPLAILLTIMGFCAYFAQYWAFSFAKKHQPHENLSGKK